MVIVLASSPPPCPPPPPQPPTSPTSRPSMSARNAFPRRAMYFPFPTYVKPCLTNIRDALRYCTVTPFAAQALRFRPTVPRAGRRSRFERELEVRNLLDGAGDPEQHGLSEVVAHNLY